MTILTHHAPILFRDPLPEQVDVVIIGAGIIGITTAWFLCRNNLKVLVCEKGRVAGEQSSRNWGWIRQQGRDEAELPIMIESMSIWREFAMRIPDIGFHQGGSLYLCENQDQLSTYGNFLKIAENHQLETQILNRDRLYKLLHNTPENWYSALYTPTDARAEPPRAVPAIAGACHSAGVSIIENCGVENISFRNRQVEGVNTDQGFINCNRVLCCSGHWSAKLLDQAGIQIPQLSVKASVGRTAPAPLLFEGNASGSNISFRCRQDGGYTIAMTDYLEVIPSIQSIKHIGTFWPLLQAAKHKLRLRFYDETAHVNPFTDEADYKRLPANRVLNPKPGTQALTRMRQILDLRLPVLRDIPIVESWSGMIDAMPDAVPILDKVDNISGLFVATGFSGHGFGIGPACGKIMASLIEAKSPGHDINRFRLSRFSDGSKLILGPSI